MASPLYPTTSSSAPFSIEESMDPLQGQKLELSISCSGLKYVVSSKCSTMVVMYMMEAASQEWKEVGRTEAIKGETSPEFVQKFIIERFFEESAEHLKFAVYNVDPGIQDLSNKVIELSIDDARHAAQDATEPWGEVYCAIGDIASSRNMKYVADLRSQSEERGKITIRGEEPDYCKDVVFMSWKSKNPEGIFGKDLKLFMEFKRCNEDNTFVPVFRTRPNSSLTWEAVEISVQCLCNGDEERTIRVDVYEEEKNQLAGSFDTRVGKLNKKCRRESIYTVRKQLVGSFDTRLSKMEKGSYEENIYQPQLDGKRANCREFTLEKIRKERRPTFHDFIQGGMQLSFVVGIDFTKSNGNPRLSTSLHAIGRNKKNQYELAIQAAGHVLQYYDSDKLIPAFGFGARVPPLNEKSHKFPINFNPEDPSCNGVHGVLEHYRSCVRKVKLVGPTNFAPIIQHVSEQASRINDASNYFVLLIITDGVYSDRDATLEAIVAAAKLPMSIIIVGVGDEDFSDMSELDGDEVRISYHGEEAERDIVQFVPLREHLIGDGTKITGQKRLNAELLEEIPDQIIEYMNKKKLQPTYYSR